MSTLRYSVLPLCAMMAAFVDVRPVAAIVVGEVDAFTADQEGWRTGDMAGAGAVTRIANGGPMGEGDAYLQVRVDPATTGIVKMVVYNQQQWGGNYLAAGVTGISMDVRLEGPEAMHLRLAFGTDDAPLRGGDWFVSNEAVVLPAGSGWTNLQFPISSTALGDFSGGASYDAVMTNVATLRLLHVTSVSPYGDVVDLSSPTVLGVDNVTALGGAAPRPGDFDGDGTVDADDLMQWRVEYGATAGSDADGDGDTDGNDFLIWQRNLGATTNNAAVHSLPEPGAISLALAAVVGLVRGSRFVGRRSKQQRISGR